MLTGTGWCKQDVDERDYTVDHPRVRHLFGLLKSVSLPSSVDLRYLCPPVEDQGELGSCTAHSAIGAMEILERKIYNTKHQSTPVSNCRVTHEDHAEGLRLIKERHFTFYTILSEVIDKQRKD